MPDEIKVLIDALRRGQFEDPSEKISLLSAALQEQNADLGMFLTLLGAPQIPLRLAALDAVRERKEPALVQEVASLVGHTDSRIRTKVAEALIGRTDKASIEALKTLFLDDESSVRETVLKSTIGRPEFRTAQETLLEADPSWSVRLGAVAALDGQKSPEVVKSLFKALRTDDDDDVRRRSAEVIEKRFVSQQSGLEKVLPSEIAALLRAEANLKDLGPERFPRLMSWITQRTTISVDPETLTKYGTDLTALAENNTLPRAYCLSEQCETVLKLLHRVPWRSLALLGEAGTGKSALVNELVYHLAKPEHGGWRVLRISPTDFMAGTKYLGEWETKVKELVEAIRRPRRVLLYVPNLSDLSAVGTWSRSDASVATALAPYLEDGSILILGESVPQEFEKGLGRIPSLQRLFDRVLVPEASIPNTRDVLACIRDEGKSQLSDQTLDQLLELSNQFLSHISRPGNAVQLLREVIKKEKESAHPISFRDVLECLSKSTGVPVDLLDDATPLQPVAIREFFEKRIMGQPEAVDVVVDLVTLIKAGVTDPNKPFGVFLFVGPTGVGKTELARALAEYIFGDAARLKRFDMSEFASVDGFTRLIGGANENGLLTDAVRQHPFSVVLLDEIEKSHVNVFDLCLQIFDAGRLTDGRGRTIDFRRTIVILTSNIGSAIGAAPLGFVTLGNSAPPDVDKDRTFRELSRFFRPEFLNRLDRIVQFRPLSLEVAEQIAKREVEIVLQRSGIQRRQLAVDIDPAVISLLVREGYSPHFGARPLKRTVERLLLLPIARAISSGSIKVGSILRLTATGTRVSALITKPIETKAVVIEKTVSEFDDALREAKALSVEIGELVQPLMDRKSELLLKTKEPDFFRDSETRTSVLDEIHKLEQFISLYEMINRRFTGLQDWLLRRKRSDGDEEDLRKRLGELTSELKHLRDVAQCKDAEELGDVLLTVTLVDRVGKPQGAVEKLVEMYSALAKRKRLAVEVLGELYDDKNDVVFLLVSGLGACALLKNEAGLHQFDQRFKERQPRNSREVIRENREVVRIEVHPVKAEPSKQWSRGVKLKTQSLKPVQNRLITKADLSVSLFHETSLRSLDLWTAGPKEKALERGFLILYTLSESGASNSDLGAIIRHYDIGVGARVKDARTGRSTTRVDLVFKGDFRVFES